MSWRTGVYGSCAVAAIVLLLSAPAIASAKSRPPVTGTLSQPGYTVIALGANGRARSVQAVNGRFRLRLPAAVATLELRAPDGGYAGPVVVVGTEKGKRAILGIRAGAKLGRVELRLRKGYAKVKRKLLGKWVDTTRAARAKNGVPIGAGKDGLVRSKKARGGAPGDGDLDGIPNSLDIDDDGDLIIDDYDRSTHRSASRSSASRLASQSAVGQSFPDGSFLHLSTDLFGGGADATNVNAGSSDEQIAAAQRDRGRLGVLWVGIDSGSGELDCGTLSYCSRGGTGRLQADGPDIRAESAAFPECCDSDNDGFGSFTQLPVAPDSPFQFSADQGGMSLYHGATVDQIHAGDVLIERATMHGTPVQFASSVGFVFSTFPVLAAYTDGQGDSASFKHPRSMLGCAPGPIFDPASSCPAPVRAGSNGHVLVTMTFWRPQRRRVEGEADTGKWMDVGNLAYGATVTSATLGAPSGFCPQSSYSGMDPNLTPLPLSRSAAGPPVLGGARYADQVGDQPSNPANTFTFTVDFTDCLASKGLSMDTTQPVNMGITGLAENDKGGSVFMASSGVSFILQP